MDMILSILLCLILIGLGVIHFNWALCGKFGYEESLPTDESGKRVLNPGKIDSAIVGIGLTLFGLFYGFRSGMSNLILPEWIVDYGGWVIPGIFILRAIGDFKFVGFFKKIKQTKFGTLDTRYYSPLCLLIGMVGGIVQIIG